MPTVKVRLLHNSSIPNARWCDPVGWDAGNVLLGAEYDEGSWWQGWEQVAGLVWIGNPNEYGVREVIECELSALRVASCGECRILGPVFMKEPTA